MGSPYLFGPSGGGSSSGATDESFELTNLGLAASVSGNALTVALKDRTGSDPSSSSAVKIGFRASSATSGTYSQNSVIASLSLTVSNGSTLGLVSGVATYLYVYALDNSGTTELAISNGLVDEGSLQSTTAEGGAGGADSPFVLYSTTARTSKAVRLIGRVLITNTAGAWSASPTEVSIAPFSLNPPVAFRAYRATDQTGVNPNNSTIKINVDTVDRDTHGAFSTSNNRYVVPVTGYYVFTANITVNATNVLANRYAVNFLKNGSAYESSQRYVQVASNLFVTSGTTTPVYLTAGEYFELALYGEGNNSASTLTVAGDAGISTVFGGFRIT